MKKTTATLTLIGSFLVLGLLATAHGSGRGSNYEYRGDYRGRYYDDYRGSRYEYRGDRRYSDDDRYEYRGDRRYSDDRYEYRDNRRYSNDDRYEYRGNGRRPVPARVPTDTGTNAPPATAAPATTAPATTAPATTAQ